MQVLPVLDILDGIVVRGVGGRRSNYRPIISRLTSSHEPLTVANAIRNEFGLSQHYIADLDGIMHRRPNLSLYRQLIAGDFRLLIDPGIREPDEARSIQELKGAEVIVGLETCRTPDELRRIVASAGRNVTFSLDLFQGVPRTGQSPVTVHSPGTGSLLPRNHETADSVPKHDSLGNRENLANPPLLAVNSDSDQAPTFPGRSDSEFDSWSGRPEEIVRQSVNSHVASIIILDLSDVGMGTGGSTDSLCRFVRNEFPRVRLITGGGVRGRDDLKRLSDLGVDAVLVASALHDGRLLPQDI